MKSKKTSKSTRARKATTKDLSLVGRAPAGQVKGGDMAQKDILRKAQKALEMMKDA